MEERRWQYTLLKASISIKFYLHKLNVSGIIWEQLGQEPASRGSSYAELTPELTRSLRGRASYAKLIFQNIFAPLAPEMGCDENPYAEGLRGAYASIR